MRALLASAGVLFASCAAASCLASFNDLSQGTCEGSVCADATMPDAGDHKDGGTRADAHKTEAGKGQETATDASACHGVPDGGTCGAAPDSCHDAPTCVAGVCTPQDVTDGTICGLPMDACHVAPICTSGKCGASLPLADGLDPADSSRMCCGGTVVDANTDTNCGVCGIKCNTADGQKCAVADGHYFCTPCKVGQCWSGCCSDSPEPTHCSPSNCDGVCATPDVCPNGSHCQFDGTVDFCSY